MRYSILILLCIFMGGCTDFWSDSNKRSFKETCSAEALRFEGSEEKADEYCDCVLRKMMKKYPNELDAFDHMGDLTHDTSLLNCKTEIAGTNSKN